MKYTLILNAIIFVSVLFVAAYFFRADENFKTYVVIALVGFILQNGLIDYNNKKHKKDHNK